MHWRLLILPRSGWSNPVQAQDRSLIHFWRVNPWVSLSFVQLTVLLFQWYTPHHPNAFFRFSMKRQLTHQKWVIIDQRGGNERAKGNPSLVLNLRFSQINNLFHFLIPQCIFYPDSKIFLEIFKNKKKTFKKFKIFSWSGDSTFYSVTYSLYGIGHMWQDYR